MQELKDKALVVRDLYKQLNSKKGENNWEYLQYMEGFVGDVGDLMKLLMAKAKYRSHAGDLEEDIKHELSDCLWSVFVLADELGVDLEKAFRDNMETLKTRVEGKINN
jgi:NTP pyrophosphatase (non-canonical NTP hydrolase)